MRFRRFMRARGPPRYMSEYAVSHPMRGYLYGPVPICLPDLPHRQLPGRLIHAVDEEHAVEVIGFVLQAPGQHLRADHLDGVLFIDRMDQPTRKQAMKAIREANWDGTVKITPHRMTDRIF